MIDIQRWGGDIAGLLDDGVLSQMDWDKFTRVTAPKIRGGWLLHHVTQTMELDFFVLSSSILSLTGSAGQANYTAGNAFLDALTQHRRTLGLPSMTINWGPWEDAGLATASGDRGKAIWQARGTQYIPAEDGMRVFDHLMQHPVDHAAVTITDWAIYLDQFADPPPFYAVLLRQVGVRRSPKLLRDRESLSRGCSKRRRLNIETCCWRSCSKTSWRSWDSASVSACGSH